MSEKITTQNGEIQKQSFSTNTRLKVPLVLLLVGGLLMVSALVFWEVTKEKPSVNPVEDIKDTEDSLEDDFFETEDGLE